VIIGASWTSHCRLRAKPTIWIDFSRRLSFFSADAQSRCKNYSIQTIKTLQKLITVLDGPQSRGL
jgi:hypothetical protein